MARPQARSELLILASLPKPDAFRKFPAVGTGRLRIVGLQGTGGSPHPGPLPPGVGLELGHFRTRGINLGSAEAPFLRSPPGFRRKAQGCEERATLGQPFNHLTTPTELRLNPTGTVHPIQPGACGAELAVRLENSSCDGAPLDGRRIG